MILRITLDVNRKHIKLRAVSLLQLSYLYVNVLYSDHVICFSVCLCARFQSLHYNVSSHVMCCVYKVCLLHYNFTVPYTHAWQSQSSKRRRQRVRKSNGQRTLPIWTQLNRTSLVTKLVPFSWDQIGNVLWPWRPQIRGSSSIGLRAVACTVQRPHIRSAQLFNT